MGISQSTVSRSIAATLRCPTSKKFATPYTYKIIKITDANLKPSSVCYKPLIVVLFYTFKKVGQ